MDEDRRHDEQLGDRMPPTLESNIQMTAREVPPAVREPETSRTEQLAQSINEENRTGEKEMEEGSVQQEVILTNADEEKEKDIETLKIGKQMTEEEVQKRVQLMKECEPMWLSNQFVEKPCTVLSIGFIFLFIVAFVTNELGYFEINE